MTDNADNADPLTDCMRLLRDDRQRRSDEHAVLRASDGYQSAIRQVDRYIHDYGLGINAIDIAATRYPPWFDELISLRIKPHLVQSMIAASHMIKKGLHDPARREMRFLVEASVKALWLDRGAPPLQPHQQAEPRLRLKTVSEKVAALNGLGGKSFGQIVDGLQFGLLDDPAIGLYRKTAKDLYGTLSTTTHVSSRNVKCDLLNFEKGRHFAFETAKDVNAIARQLRTVLDLALTSHFEAFDHSSVGDLFETHFAPRWSFLKMPLVKAIDRHFDYKHGRRLRRGQIPG